MESRFVRTENHVLYLKALATPRPTVSPEVTHHVLVVDRSGSMWGDIEKLKQSIEQALAVESYTNENVLTTLISFSTDGDVTLHWKGVQANKVMELSQPYIKELRSIRATYLTGISQALFLALAQIDPTQTTGLTLFTDGYANSPSSYSEIQSLDKFTKKAGENPRLFMNCIGYRDWCDWPRLQSMSNALSGKTVKANSFKDVLDAMRDTQALLSGKMRPAIVLDAEAGATLVAVNRTTGQVNASSGSLTLRGLGENDEITTYAVTKAPATYNIPAGTKVVPTEEAYLFGALAVAYTNMKELRVAKELLFSSGNKTLWSDHQSAMTPSTLSAMMSDLTLWVKEGNNANYEMGKNTRPKFNLFDLAATLNALPNKSIGIASDEFYKSYRRRSIKRIPGTREADGTLTPPKAKFVPREPHTYVRGVEFNTSDASVQLETVQVVDLLRLDTNQVVKEIKFVSLDGLRDFKSYTLVSSGERNVEVLPLEVYTKQAWEALEPYMLPSEYAEGFTPGMKVRLPLKKFRMEAENTPSAEDILSGLQLRMTAEARVKALSAMQDKAEASPFSPEQVEALKEFHLTPALYFSPPSTYHYVDKDEAVKKGEVDAFTRYKIYFGTVDILNSGEFRSGNAFLQRRYSVVDATGVVPEKPTLAGYLKGDKYTVKPPGKGKDTKADDLMALAFDDILLATGARLTNEQISERLITEKKTVEDANALVQGLVMEIGCTGLLPQNLEPVTTRYEPEEFATKYGVKLGKAEKEGIFYVAGNGLVISILPETSWYTVKVADEDASAAAK